MAIDLSGLAEKTKNEIIALYHRAVGAADKHASNEVVDHATKHFGDHPTRLKPDHEESAPEPVAEAAPELEPAAEEAPAEDVKK